MNPLRLVFISDGVGVGAAFVSGVVRALMAQWKSKIGVVSEVISATESESAESERFHFFRLRLRLRRLRSAYDLVKTRLSESEAEAEGWTNHNARRVPRFVIGLFLPLLLPTPTIWFSLDHKQNVSDGVVSGIRALFSLDHKLYVSNFDSDPVTNEN